MVHYNLGDILVCKKEFNGQELELTNADIRVGIGEIFVVTDVNDYEECVSIEILGLSENFKGKYFFGYNDRGVHEIFDEVFEVRSVNFQEILNKKD